MLAVGVCGLALDFLVVSIGRFYKSSSKSAVYLARDLLATALLGLQFADSSKPVARGVLDVLWICAFALLLFSAAMLVVEHAYTHARKADQGAEEGAALPAVPNLVDAFSPAIFADAGTGNVENGVVPENQLEVDEARPSKPAPSDRERAAEDGVVAQVSSFISKTGELLKGLLGGGEADTSADVQSPPPPPPGPPPPGLLVSKSSGNLPPLVWTRSEGRLPEMPSPLSIRAQLSPASPRPSPSAQDAAIAAATTPAPTIAHDGSKKKPEGTIPRRASVHEIASMVDDAAVDSGKPPAGRRASGQEGPPTAPRPTTADLAKARRTSVHEIASMVDDMAVAAPPVGPPARRASTSAAPVAGAPPALLHAPGQAAAPSHASAQFHAATLSPATRRRASVHEVATSPVASRRAAQEEPTRASLRRSSVEGLRPPLNPK